MLDFKAMKRKTVLIVIISILCACALFGLDLKQVQFAMSYEKCSSFKDSVKITAGISGDNYDVLISEYGLKKIDIDGRIGHEKYNGFFWTGLANTSYSYGLGGWSGLGVLFNYALNVQWFYLKVGLGAQAAVSYSQYQEQPLFALSPLLDAQLGVTLKAFNASIYLNLADPYEREWKAVPTIGIKTKVEVLGCNIIFADFFIKFAEYMVDPITLITGYGVRIGTVINCKEGGKT